MPAEPNGFGATSGGAKTGFDAPPELPALCGREFEYVSAHLTARR
jgi:hypothetical protein